VRSSPVSHFIYHFSYKCAKPLKNYRVERHIMGNFKIACSNNFTQILVIRAITSCRLVETNILEKPKVSVP